MAPNLTIRNCTEHPLALKLLERYSLPSSGSSSPLNLSSLSSNITSLVSSTSGTSSSNSSAKAAPPAEDLPSGVDSAKDDINETVAPFSSSKTSVSVEDGKDKKLRLTFAVEGQRFRVDLTSKPQFSLALTPVAGQPKNKFNAIFRAEDSHLTILEEVAPLNRWMSAFPDSTPLSALSIPGTHNSSTYHTALPSVRCQAVSPTDQLNNGVRFFDVRVQPEDPTGAKDGLILVHGAFPVSLSGSKYFRQDLLDQILDFLKANPSETMILSLKREGTGKATDQQLSQIIRQHYIPPPDGSGQADQKSQWWTTPRVPTLGEARGRIVLMRRFALDDATRKLHGGKGVGLDAECWAYNTAHDTHGDVCVQDFCEVLETPTIEKKIEFSVQQLERAGACDHSEGGPNQIRKLENHKEPLYLNFLSASNFWKAGCWPEKVAGRLNPAITQFLCEKYQLQGGGGGGSGPNKNAGPAKGDGATGVVVCDWVGNSGNWDLVKCIVGMNAKLAAKVKGGRGGGGGGGGGGIGGGRRGDNDDDDDDDRRGGQGGRGGRGGGGGGRGGGHADEHDGPGGPRRRQEHEGEGAGGAPGGLQRRREHEGEGPGHGRGGRDRRDDDDNNNDGDDRPHGAGGRGGRGGGRGGRGGRGGHGRDDD